MAIRDLITVGLNSGTEGVGFLITRGLGDFTIVPEVPVPVGGGGAYFPLRIAPRRPSTFRLSETPYKVEEEWEAVLVALLLE